MARWIPPALWAALILFLGSREGAALPAPEWPGFDKAAHLLVYLVLGFLLVRARRPGTARGALLLAVSAGLLWGALDEWIQSGTAGRTTDWADLLADGAGAALGGWAAFRTRSGARRS